MTYYINWSRITNRYLVKEVGTGEIIGAYDTKIEAEKVAINLETIDHMTDESY